MQETVACIIQSRISSTRFPSKALELIEGDPMIVHVIRRALAIKDIDCVVLAVPKLEVEWYNLVVERFKDESRFFSIGGDHYNVVLRYWEAALAVGATHIMRVTGDCPLLCPYEAGKVFAKYKELFDAGRSKEVFVTNDTVVSGIPDGCDVEMFHVHWLDTIVNMPQGKVTLFDKEHVTTFIRRFADEYLIKQGPPSKYKLSVDTEVDLRFVRAIFRELQKIINQYPDNRKYSLEATMEALSYV